MIAREAGLKPLLIPVPFAAWHAMALTLEMLPSPPITRNQVELMQIDNVSSPEMPGFGVEEVLRQMLRTCRSESFLAYRAEPWAGFRSYP